MASLRLLLLAFLVGAATMILELAAPRVLAPHLGTTALVWTVTIATFLGGLAVGNLWGGRLADRRGPGLAQILLVLAALATGISPALDALARISVPSLPHGWRTLVAVPLAFLPVAVVLGMVPPVLVRAALQGTAPRGRTLGHLAAAGAAGSVAGTALAGFVLIPRVGTRGIVLATAVALAVALVLVPRRETPARPPDQPPPSPRGRLPLSSILLAALAGAALLTLEIAVGRLASDRLGSSIYTWTAVIGVVLTGCALGNAVGGRLADRHPPRALLGTLLTVATLAALGLVWAPRVMDAVRAFEVELRWPLRVLLAVALTGFFPAFTIGTLSPVVIRAALGPSTQDGRIVGALFGAGTAGAVLAAIATSYLLVPGIGLDATLLGVPLLLLVGRALARRRVPWLLGVSWLALAILTLAPQPPIRAAAGALRLPVEEADTYVRDSRYARIRVVPMRDRWVPLEAEPDTLGLRTDLLLEERVSWDAERSALTWEGPMGIREQARLRTHMESEADRRIIARLRRLSGQDVRALRMDRLVHSYVNLDDPTYLGYDYERVYDALVRRIAPPGRPLRALFLGGGGYSFQRRLLATRSGPLTVVTVEIDEAVTETAETHLGLLPDERHEIRHEDARTYLAAGSGESPRYDVVFGDAFDDLAVPFHLTTLEFAEEVASALTPRGVYVVNMVDTFDSGLFLGAFVETLDRVFEHVVVLTAPPRVDDLRNTFVLLASRYPVNTEDLRDADGRPFAAAVYPRAEIDALRARTGHLVLRDDHAPVEILLAPVVEARQ